MIILLVVLYFCQTISNNANVYNQLLVYDIFLVVIDSIFKGFSEKCEICILAVFDAKVRPPIKVHPFQLEMDVHTCISGAR